MHRIAANSGTDSAKTKKPYKHLGIFKLDPSVAVSSVALIEILLEYGIHQDAANSLMKLFNQMTEKGGQILLKGPLAIITMTKFVGVQDISLQLNDLDFEIRYDNDFTKTTILNTLHDAKHFEKGNPINDFFNVDFNLMKNNAQALPCQITLCHTRVKSTDPFDWTRIRLPLDAKGIIHAQLPEQQSEEFSRVCKQIASQQFNIDWKMVQNNPAVTSFMTRFVKYFHQLQWQGYLLNQYGESNLVPVFLSYLKEKPLSLLFKELAGLCQHKINFSYYCKVTLSHRFKKHNINWINLTKAMMDHVINSLFKQMMPSLRDKRKRNELKKIFLDNLFSTLKEQGMSHSFRQIPSIVIQRFAEKFFSAPPVLNHELPSEKQRSPSVEFKLPQLTLKRATYAKTNSFFSPHNRARHGLAMVFLLEDLGCLPNNASDNAMLDLINVAIELRQMGLLKRAQFPDNQASINDHFLKVHKLNKSQPQAHYLFKILHQLNRCNFFNAASDPQQIEKNYSSLLQCWNELGGIANTFSNVKGDISQQQFDQIVAPRQQGLTTHRITRSY